jgi:hypothetical protein
MKYKVNSEILKVCEVKISYQPAVKPKDRPIGVMNISEGGITQTVVDVKYIKPGTSFGHQPQHISDYLNGIHDADGKIDREMFLKLFQSGYHG